jgi:UDP-N-acetylmuramate dehydrogenase
MKIEQEKIKENFKTNIIFGEKLSKYSWFNVGGNAEVFFRPDSKDQLIDFFKSNKKFKKFTILGVGSNTLIRDGGIKGVTIKLSSKFSSIKLLKNDIIEVGASTLDKKVSNFATENSIGGLEFLSCIPGSIGGAIIMNSGCYGNEISNILISVKVLDFKGVEREIKKEEINFFYRGSSLKKNIIILSAKLKGFSSNREVVFEKQNLFVEKKKKSQPSSVKTCGSTFKNTRVKKAWELIKDSDCLNLSVGNVKISEKHCNFFVNTGNAKAADIEQLINLVKEKVLKKTGTNLDLEIKLIGQTNKI